MINQDRNRLCRVDAVTQVERFSVFNDHRDLENEDQYMCVVCAT